MYMFLVRKMKETMFINNMGNVVEQIKLNFFFSKFQVTNSEFLVTTRL